MGGGDRDTGRFKQCAGQQNSGMVRKGKMGGKRRECAETVKQRYYRMIGKNVKFSGRRQEHIENGVAYPRGIGSEVGMGDGTGR